MGDRATEFGLPRLIGIDVNVLMILRHVGKIVDPGLIDEDPIGFTDLSADERFEFIDADARQGAGHASSFRNMCWRVWAVMPPSTGMMAPETKLPPRPQR